MYPGEVNSPEEFVLSQKELAASATIIKIRPAFSEQMQVDFI